MSRVLVIDDAAEIRELMKFVLRKDGHEVFEAADGVVGLALAKQHLPALVVTDVQMPGMNGFELILKLRQDPQIAATPIILLTALVERADVRQGMNVGADDYITKPFRPKELSEAVAAQLAKRKLHDDRQQRALSDLLLDETKRLSGVYEGRLSRELQERWAVRNGFPNGDERFEHATALFVDIVGNAALGEKLDADELFEVVKRFYGSVGDTMFLFGARHIHFVGEGMLALFAEDKDPRSVGHGQRAVRAALRLQESAGPLRRFLEHRYPDRELPEFRVTAGLYSGPVTLAALQGPVAGGRAQSLPIGEAVGLAMRLQQQANPLHWSVVASREMLDGLGGEVRVGASALIELPGRSQGVPVCEVLRFPA